MYLSGISLVLISYCIVCARSAASSASLDLVPGTLISFASHRIKRATPIACDASLPMSQCASDCKTLLFCDGANLLGQLACPAKKPACDTTKNTCVAEQPVGQCGSQGKPDPACPGDEGYFPDPKNCRIYNYCDGRKILASYSCPIYYAFDMVMQQCRRGAPCGIVNCFGKTVALHSTYPFLYAFCSNNAIIEGSYSACEDTTQEFDLNEFACQSKCRTEGNIPHETECPKYYRCLATGAWGLLERTEMLCPKNQKFDKTKLLCDKTQICEPKTEGTTVSVTTEIVTESTTLD